MQIPTLGMLIDGPSGENSLRLENFLGGGAFGDVYKAVDITEDKNYAVKFPRLTVLANTAREMQAFLNEAQASQQIQHPNVVRVTYVETNSADLPPYLVMEYVSGGTLKSYLDQYRERNELVSIPILHNWSQSLVAGIAAINAKMLHRDLKPDNILIDGDTLKIGDFGLSKIIGEATRSRTFKGLQHMLYMAPEGWELETNEIQIDMYALGIILYEIATLQYPYDQPSDFRNPRKFKDMHLFQQAKPLRAIRTDLPSGFTQIVTRLLEKRPQDRFPNWLEVVDALGKTWNTSSNHSQLTQPLIGELLSEVSRLHDGQTRQRLETERQKTDLAGQQKLDDFQVSRLIEAIREAVAKFNEQSAHGQISEIEGQGLGKAKLAFLLPFSDAKSVSVNFFPVRPPLELRNGSTVRLAAQVIDVKQAGLNYLLVRTDQADLYGQWKVCKVRHTGGLDPEKVPPRVEPFGLPERSIREIEMADKALHIYQLDWSGDLQEAFLEALLNSMRHSVDGK